MIRLILISILCLLTVSRCFAQRNVSNYDYADIVFTHIIEQDVVSCLDNRTEVLSFQRQALKSAGFLLMTDSISFIDSNEHRGFIRSQLVGTNYYVIYYVNMESWSSILLSYGYEGEERIYQKGWKNLIKKEHQFFTRKSENEIKNMFLDFYVPSGNQIYYQDSFTVVNAHRMFGMSTSSSLESLQDKQLTQKKGTYSIKSGTHSKSRCVVQLTGTRGNYTVKHLIPQVKSGGDLRDFFGYSNNYLGVSIRFIPK